ncbi:hypothetical protein FPV67DRAFT_877362 [Lyophyllum atratum]|nr:hypothetical protein FPV67DRAFT_877362 [Lyophyllum atratum]
MAGNQSNTTQIVLPPCRLLLDEVDSAESKAPKLTLRIPQVFPLRQRPEGHPPYTRAEDAYSIPDLDSYHADDEISDSEDASPGALTDDDSDSSGRSSGDSLQTPQTESAVFTKQWSTTAKQYRRSRQAVRVSTNSTQASFIPFSQSPMELSPIDIPFTALTRQRDSDIPLNQHNSNSPSYFPEFHFSPPSPVESNPTPAYAPSSPESQKEVPALEDAPSAPSVDKGKRRATEESQAQEQDTPAEAPASPPICEGENCLKAQYIKALFDQSHRLPSPRTAPSPPTPSQDPPTQSASGSNNSSARPPYRSNTASKPTPADGARSLDSTGNSSTSANDASTVEYTFFKQIPPRRAHMAFDIVKPEIAFRASKGRGVPLSDIIEYEGIYMVRAADTLALWEDAAPGTSIDLVIHWKGHQEEKVYPILVKCACGFVIRRGQLGLALAKAQISYFKTSKLDPSYITPPDNIDLFHRSHFIVKDPSTLHLRSLFTPDSGVTWRTHHTIVEDPSILTVDPEPPRDPSDGQLLYPNARILLAVHRFHKQRDENERLRAEEEVRAQEEYKAKQEAKALKKLEALEMAKAKKEAKARKYDALALGFVSCRMGSIESNCKCKSHGTANQATNK